MRIAFLSYKPHLDRIYSEISAASRVEKVFLLSRFRGLRYEHLPKKIEIIPITVKTFGVRLIMNEILKRDFYSPNYVPGLKDIFTTCKAAHIILFDYLHWYTLQALAFARVNTGVRIYIWSETKEWPRNLFSRLVSKSFFILARRNFSHLAQVFTYTEEGKQWWRKNAPGVAVEVLPAPVEVNLFTPAEKRQWLPNGTLRILMNARYSAYKRHEDLLQAAVSLRNQGVKFHITLVGRADAGRKKIEQLVEQYDLTPMVTFLDPLPMNEMPALYHRHDVLVLASYNEAIGMVVPEAMACGIPTITSDTVGANVYVVPHETGLVFETGNVTALATAIATYSDTPALCQEHGRAATRRIQENFTVEKITRQLLSLLGMTSDNSLGVAVAKKI